VNVEEMCPNCLAIWGFDEIERGRCYACGWPDVEEPDDDLPESDADDAFIEDAQALTAAASENERAAFYRWFNTLRPQLGEDEEAGK